jgi:ATP-dependent Lon protease
VRAAAEKWGFPLLLKIKDSIDLSSGRGKLGEGLALVRIVEQEDEAVSVAGVMIRNHELLRKMQRGRRLGNMEREAQSIQSNILKTEKDTMHDRAKVQRLKSALSQVQGDISKFKRETAGLTTQIMVTPSSRAARSIADYRGQPLWDPEMQSTLMECDRATQVIRAAYYGDMSTISCLGISKELIDEHEGAAGRQKRPEMIQEGMDRIKHLLDQMNEVETDDVEHHQKAAELQDEWNKLSNDHIIAATR